MLFVSGSFSFYIWLVVKRHVILGIKRSYLFGYLYHPLWYNNMKHETNKRGVNEVKSNLFLTIVHKGTNA